MTVEPAASTPAPGVDASQPDSAQTDSAVTPLDPNNAAPADSSGDSATAPGGLAPDGLIDGDAAALAATEAGLPTDTSIDSAKLAALQISDPELGTIMSNSALPKSDLSLRWDETASRDYYTSELHLAWRKSLGDYAPTIVGSVVVPNAHQQITVSIPVSGNDFYLRGSGGPADFMSRYGSSTLGPALIVNGHIRYSATRDVAISASLVATLKGQRTMSDRNAMLIAFDNYVPQPGDRAVLQLTSTHQYGSHTLTVYHPNIQRILPTIDATVDPTVVADVRAGDLDAAPNLTVANAVATAYWEKLSPTAMADVFPLPSGQEYFLTTMVRLHSDWSDQGGKLPGLSDTGMASNTSGKPLSVNGTDCANSGWGGRSANGCRWSARTGWGGRVGNFVGLHTYYYAMSPTVGWGYVQNWPTPAPVGQWFAYVERVRVNTPGQADGRLSYWLCTQLEGCTPQFDRQDIKWRAADLDQALINEAWVDVYCGGLACPGPKPWPRSTIDFKRMTTTVGLPDLAALAAEVRTMNAPQ